MKFKSYTQEEFEEKSKNVHKNKYDYSEAVYTTSKNRVTIICPIHGRFEQFANNHMKGAGCPSCSSTRAPKTKDSFVEEAKRVHADKYDYTDTVYHRYHEKVSILCKKHGYFNQSPASHLAGKGCTHCARESSTNKRRADKHEIISNLNKDYPDFSFKLHTLKSNTWDTLVEVTCPFHGSSIRKMGSIIYDGNKCRKCFKYGGIKLDTTSYLYINAFMLTDGSIIGKYGITNKPKDRFSMFLSKNKDTVVDLINLNLFSYKDGVRFSQIERHIKNKYKPVLCREHLVDGYTETFDIENYHDILHLIEKELNFVYDILS